MRGYDLGVRDVAVLSSWAGASFRSDLDLSRIQSGSSPTFAGQSNDSDLRRLPPAFLVVWRDPLDAVPPGEPGEVVKETPWWRPPLKR